MTERARTIGMATLLLSLTVLPGKTLLALDSIRFSDRVIPIEDGFTTLNYVGALITYGGTSTLLLGEDNDPTNPVISDIVGREPFFHILRVWSDFETDPITLQEITPSWLQSTGFDASLPLNLITGEAVQFEGSEFYSGYNGPMVFTSDTDVPEPASFGLLLGGALLALRHRNKKSCQERMTLSYAPHRDSILT